MGYQHMSAPLADVVACEACGGTGIAGVTSSRGYFTGGGGFDSIDGDDVPCAACAASHSPHGDGLRPGASLAWRCVAMRLEDIPARELWAAEGGERLVHVGDGPAAVALLIEMLGVLR